MKDYSINLNEMSLEEIVSLEKEFIRNEIGFPLIDSDEEYMRRKDGYRFLARKHWPEYFINNKIKEGYMIHHIDFNPRHNVVSNLAILNHSEHQMIHNMFDKTYAEVREKQSESAKNASPDTRRKQSEAMSGEKNPNYGKVFSADYRKNISDGMKRKWEERKRNENS